MLLTAEDGLQLLIGGFAQGRVHQEEVDGLMLLIHAQQHHKGIQFLLLLFRVGQLGQGIFFRWRCLYR